MALSDFEVFNEYMYLTMTEVVDQQVDLFNSASRGTITLQTSAHQGDFSEKAMYALVDGLVRRRDAYGSGAVSEKQLTHNLDVAVKVAAGTPPVRIDPGQYNWIKANPQEGGVIYGQQLAKAMLQDMLNTAILGGYAALSQTTEVVYDGTAGTLTPTALNNGARLFGDRSDDIIAWIAHSKVVHDYYGDNLANVERLFTYGTVNVNADAFGRIFVISDSPSLVLVDGGGVGIDHYHTLGLTREAFYVGQNDDFDSNTETKNGDENIIRSIQSEWSYQLAVKGYAWDKTNGGASPADAAIATATNWDKYATSNKDAAGVVVDTL